MSDDPIFSAIENARVIYDDEVLDESGVPPAAPLPDVAPTITASREKQFRFPLTPLAAIVADTTDLHVVKGLLPRTGLAIIWGPPKCGKSFWTLDVLMHLAMGRNYRGHRVKQSSVVYCVLEGQRGFKNRVVAIKQENDTPADTPFQIMQAPLKLISDHKVFIAEIRSQFGAGCKPAVVCIDTLNRSIEGSESDDEAMGAYLAAAEAIRNAFGCLVIIVHHCGHDGTRPRGHSSLGGALDVQIAVRKSAGDVIVAELELAKDLETGMRIASRLAIVEIGRDGDGDAVTSCVLKPADVPKATAGRPPKGERAAFDALKTAIDAHGEIAPGSSPIPPGVRVVKVETWRRYARQSGISASSEPAALKKAFDRAHTKLIDGKHVGTWGEFRWIAS